MRLRALPATLTIAALAGAAWLSVSCGSSASQSHQSTLAPPATTGATSSVRPAPSSTPPIATTPAPSSSPDATASSDDTPAAATPTIAVPADRMRVLAPIDIAQVMTLESHPPQYVVRIVSGLPNGCAQFAGVTVVRSGADVTITVENSVPRDQNIACTQVYGSHEETVALGSDFTPGNSYTVAVNERTLALIAE